MSELIEERNALVIVTDSYAGNFERTLAAWVVGAEDACMPGGWKEPDDYNENCEFFQDLFNCSFEEQFYRPATVFNLPGESGYNSVAILTEWNHADFIREYPVHYAKLIGRARACCELHGIEFKRMTWLEITPSIKTTEVTNEKDN